MTWGDYNAHQNMDQRRLEMELQQIHGVKDPDKPPHRQLGDGWIVLGMFAGAAAGAAVGGALTYWSGMLSVPLGLITGAVAGALLGTLAGDRIKRVTTRRHVRRSRTPGG